MRELVSKLLRVDFVRFCLVGGTGFVINFGLLTVLFKVFGLPVFVSQLIASEIALGSNFYLHHTWTYKHKKVAKTLQALIVQFHVSSWVAIVGSALLVSFAVAHMHVHYFVALVFASLLALAWNFTWSKFIIWRHEHAVVEERGAA